MSPLPNVAALLAKAPLDATDRFEVSCIVGPCTEEEAGELAGAILDLNVARTLHVGGVGISSFEDRTPSAPVLAAALIEAADALRGIADCAESCVGEADTTLNETWVSNTARAALARLVAFDASLKETT